MADPGLCVVPHERPWGARGVTQGQRNPSNEQRLFLLRDCVHSPMINTRPKMLQSHTRLELGPQWPFTMCPLVYRHPHHALPFPELSPSLNFSIAFIYLRRMLDTAYALDSIQSGDMKKWAEKGGLFQSKNRREHMSLRKKKVLCVYYLSLLRSSSSKLPACPL